MGAVRASVSVSLSGSHLATSRKGTDLARDSREDLAAVAATLNSRPRKPLDWRTAAEGLTEYLATAA